MAWDLLLLDASFKGVSFDVMDTTDESTRDIQQHLYPYVDGADTEDLGRKARQVTLTAVFTGVLYELPMYALLAVLNQKGPGELIHPVFGSMPQMQLVNHVVKHDAENCDYCTITLAFIEHLDSNPFFALQLPSQLAAIAGQISGDAWNTGIGLFSDVMSIIRVVTGAAARLNAIRSIANSIISTVRSEITDLVVSGQDIVQFPRAFTSDLAAGFDGFISARNLTGDSLVSNWKALAADANSVSSLPASLAAGVIPARFAAIDKQIVMGTAAPITLNIASDDLATISAIVTLTVANAMIQVASDVLLDQLESTELSAFEIEKINNDTREIILLAMQAQRLAYPVEISRLVTEPLKDAAMHIQDTAAGIIEARPPLARYRVESSTNLHLLAHKLYADYTRAGELFRLNPEIRNPNTISAGEVLNAYSR